MAKLAPPAGDSTKEFLKYRMSLNLSLRVLTYRYHNVEKIVSSSPFQEERERDPVPNLLAIHMEACRVNQFPLSILFETFKVDWIVLKKSNILCQSFINIFTNNAWTVVTAVIISLKNYLNS